tara:strand:+ start:10103 stop:10294 length:192 start_codon:yes stop_codon:yes gene_type:complete
MIDVNEVTDTMWTDIDSADHPDYCDAFIESAKYKGTEMTETELEELMDDYPDWCYENLIDFIH